MVPKPITREFREVEGFRAVLFRMVPKQMMSGVLAAFCFRAVLFRMVPKLESHA